MLYAHSLPDQPPEKWQPLEAHLSEVAELAASLAAAFNASALAFIVGYLHDLGSTNGTMLNGEAVQGDPIELISGDRISFGQVSFIYITDKGEEA